MTYLNAIKLNQVFKLSVGLLTCLALLVTGVFANGNKTSKVKQIQGKVDLGKALSDEMAVAVDLVADNLYITHTADGMVLENDEDGFIVQESSSGFRILNLDGEVIQSGQKAAALVDLVGKAIMQGNVGHHASGSEDEDEGPGVSCPEGECPYMDRYCIECGGDDEGPGETEEPVPSDPCPSCHDPVF